MAQREVHIERLLGRRVFDAEGNSIGRIEEVIAEQQGGEWVVRGYEIGRSALLHRLSFEDIGDAFLSLFGAKGQSGYKVPWDKLDLTDPQKPRLNCAAHALEPLSSSHEPD